MVRWHHRLDELKFEQAPGIVMDREAWRAVAHGSQRVGHDCATELNCGHRWTWTHLSRSAWIQGEGYLGLLA